MILLAAVYQPGPHFHRFLGELGPDLPVVLVDDGSDPPVTDLHCTVLRHQDNRGKGIALKTGLRHIAAEHPGEDVICADPDGQHAVVDVLRVAAHLREHQRMTLGVRHFDANVPLRNRFGNQLTRALFRSATGQDVRDTQTGLRGFPASMIDWLSEIPGEKFEYEMNVLLRAAEAGIPVDQVPITTTYHRGKGMSHFGAVSDSARIYKPLLRHALTRGRPDMQRPQPSTSTSG